MAVAGGRAMRSERLACPPITGELHEERPARMAATRTGNDLDFKEASRKVIPR